MKEYIRYSIFIFIYYYLTYLLIQIIGLNYNIYLISNIFGFSSYITVVIFMTVGIFLYNYKYNENGLYTLILGILIFIYSIFEFRRGIFWLPIYIIMLNIIYSFVLIIGGTVSIIFHKCSMGKYL